MSKFSCPDDYYTNCANAMVLCKQCNVVNKRASKNHYSPIENNQHLQEHPSIEKKSKQRRVLKEAQHTERQLERRIAKGTIRSGAANGDGDLCLLETLRVEVKRRGARKSWNLTWDEFCKGKRQRIDAFAIDIETPTGQRETVYMMDEDTFTQILSQLQLNHERI
jgi:hypothetical protein